MKYDKLKPVKTFCKAVWAELTSHSKDEKPPFWGWGAVSGWKLKKGNALALPLLMQKYKIFGPNANAA